MRDILRRVRRGVEPEPDGAPSKVRALQGPNEHEVHSSTEPTFVGYIDKIGVASITGWSARRGSADPIEVELHLDGEIAAKLLASEHRQDVQDAGYGDGRHGFELPVAKRQLLAAREIEIRAKREGQTETIFRYSLTENEKREAPVVFLDASDLLEFLTYHREVSGIQRVQAGYLVGLENEKLEGYEFRICARFRDNLHYMEVPFAGLAQLLREAGDADAVANEGWSDHVNRFRHALPARVAFAKGDVLFTMGAPWATENHNEAVRSAVRTSGALYFQIFYDLIPITMPEVVAVELISIFSRAMAAMMTYCDHVFSISAFSKDDLERAGRLIGHETPPVSIIPMGGTIDDADRKRDASAKAPPLVEGDFVLGVGTIEPRKNHILLYQVWKRLIAAYGADKVPKLVLVGRIGWYMEDFMRYLKASANLGGKVVLLQNISNDELGRLYDDCLFTAFPSIYEGWGLPIVESMARGKVCICSNVTSMPEAGGDCAVYIDPYSISDAYTTFETFVFDRDALARREDKVRTEFRSPSWMEAARDFRAALARALRDAAQTRAVAPLDRRARTRLGQLYRLGQVQDEATAMGTFERGIEQEEALDLLAGRGWFDPDVHCSWAVGPTARMQFALPSDAPARLVIYCEVMTPPIYLGQRCKVTFDGRLVATYVFNRGDPQKLMITVDASAGTDSLNSHDLVFDFGTLRFPTAGAQDNRLLGLGIAWLAVLDAEDVVARLAFTEAGYVAGGKSLKSLKS